MLCAVVCIELAALCRLSSALRTVALELDDARFHARGAFGLGDAVLVLLGGERAALDHALAEHLQRVRHRRDLVALAGSDRSRFEVAARTVAASSAAGCAIRAQDAAADIEPDEQDRADQRRDAEPEHHHGRERNLLPRLPGRGVGFLLHAVDQLLHADAEADIELAGFLQNGLAVIVGVELLLADLEDAGLAARPAPAVSASRSSAPLVAGVLGQQLEVRLDARLRRSLNSFSIASSVSLLFADSAAVMSDAIRLPLATTLPSCSTVRAARMASSLARDRRSVRIALSWLWASIIAGAGGGDELRLRLAQRVVLLARAGRPVSSRSRAAEPRLLIMSSMFFTVSVSAATTVLSAPSSMISPSFCSATAWVSFIFLVRSLSASSLREASSAGPWLARLALCADSCRLAARRGMSRPLRSTMVPPSCPSTRPAPALITIAMPAMTAKAAKRLPLTPIPEANTLRA